MRTRVGINGMGRVGREVLRVTRRHYDRAFEVVAVNDRMPVQTLAHLIRHDAPSGGRPGRVEVGRTVMTVDGSPLRVFTETDPSALPWAELGVDVVIEATGEFAARERAAAHLAAGARKVVLAGPGPDADVTVAIGINDDDYEASTHNVIGHVGCAANCLAPMIAVLHRCYGVRQGMVTVVHGNLVDAHQPDDLHRDLGSAREPRMSLIPATTGAIRSIERVLPDLAGRLGGRALRVPMADASIIDLTVQFDDALTPGQVNRAFSEAAGGWLKSVLRYSTEPLVSSDVIGDPASCVFDGGLTSTSGTMANVSGWFDNRSGHAHRTVELVDLVCRTLPERS